MLWACITAHLFLFVCGVSVHILGSEVLLWWGGAQATLKSHIMCSSSVVHWGCGQQLRYDWGFLSLWFDILLLREGDVRHAVFPSSYMERVRWSIIRSRHSNTFLFILVFSFRSLFKIWNRITQLFCAVTWYVMIIIDFSLELQQSFSVPRHVTLQSKLYYFTDSLQHRWLY